MSRDARGAFPLRDSSHDGLVGKAENDIMALQSCGTEQTLGETRIEDCSHTRHNRLRKWWEVIARNQFANLRHKVVPEGGLRDGYTCCDGRAVNMATSNAKLHHDG